MRTPSTSSMISARAPVHFPGILSLCQLPYFWPHVRLPLLATTRLFYHALPCTCTYPYLQGWPKRITNTRLCTWWPHQQYSMIAHLQYTCEHLRYSIILNIPRINLDEVQRNLIRFRGQVVPIGVLLTAHYVCKVDQNALPTRASELGDHTNNTAWVHTYNTHVNTYVTLSSIYQESILMKSSEIWYGSVGKLCQLPCFWPHTCLSQLYIHLLHRVLPLTCKYSLSLQHLAQRITNTHSQTMAKFKMLPFRAIVVCSLTT